MPRSGQVDILPGRGQDPDQNGGSVRALAGIRTSLQLDLPAVNVHMYAPLPRTSNVRSCRGPVDYRSGAL
jgi:hypothetical protein